MNIDQYIQFFKALSEPVRLRILNLLLSTHELCVCDLTATLDLPQSVVSRHLSYLKKHGIISSRREGNWQHYQIAILDPEHPFRKILENLNHTLELDPVIAEDLSKLSQMQTPC